MIVNGFGALNGIQIIPSALAGAARAALAAGGVNPESISPSGDLNPQALISAAFDTVEIHSALSDPIRINLNAPEDPQTAALLDRIRPSLVFRGRAGSFTIAPYGQAGGIDGSIKNAGIMIGIGLGLGVLGLLVIGRAFAR